MIGNIIIVDDDSSALKLLNDILSTESYSVRPFVSGELALRSMYAEKPDLILLDIRMPNMDGFEVCRKLKMDEKLRDIPVIFLSAATDIEDKIKAFQSGGVDYITKPFQKEEILARVATHVKLHNALKKLQAISTELRNKEERLRLAESIAHLGHWEWDALTGFFNWSEELCHIFGCQEQEKQTTYESFIDRIHPDDRVLVNTGIQNALLGQEFEIEYRIVLPDGSSRFILSRGKNVKSGQSLKILGTAQAIADKPENKVLGINLDITERKELEIKLEKQANTDVLTGCVSRRRISELLQREFDRVRRYGGALSVLMLDLDHFKRVNDQYGHDAGDRVLKSLVRISSNILRNVDMIGRLGGEEFIVILPETALEQAIETGNRLRAAIASKEMTLETGESFHFTTSIGVSSLLKADSDIDSLINRADKALYSAKNSGRNRVSI